MMNESQKVQASAMARDTDPHYQIGKLTAKLLQIREIATRMDRGTCTPEDAKRILRIIDRKP